MCISVTRDPRQSQRGEKGGDFFVRRPSIDADNHHDRNGTEENSTDPAAAAASLYPYTF